MRLLGCALFLLGQALVQPTHIHLQGHQQAAQLIVHLTGDAGALFFTHRLGPGGQFAQLLQGGFQRLRAFGHPQLQLVLGLVQSMFGQLAFGDVHKGDHRTAHLTLVKNRVTRILHRKAVAFCPPKHFAVDAAGLTAPKSVVNRAVVQGVMRAIGMGVMRQHMHVLAQHLLGLQADHAGPGRVDEDAQPVQINTENPLTGRGQHQT